MWSDCPAFVVWAGKPVNMAAKLASLSINNQLMVSERFFEKINNEKARYSCECRTGRKEYLWQEVDVKDKNLFDFEKAYCLVSNWCETHGKEYFEALLGLDK